MEYLFETKMGKEVLRRWPLVSTSGRGEGCICAKVIFFFCETNESEIKRLKYQLYYY